MSHSPKNILIIGAGFSGCIMARELAQAGHHITLQEKREHIGGNCYTYTDEKTGIIVHKYGPHIFHTDNEEVWSYVNQFGVFKTYIHQVKAQAKNQIFGLPINLQTINQFFGKTFTPKEAEGYIQDLCIKYPDEPKTFTEQALASIGKELSEAFLFGYTKKQWGMDPSDLPASILKRLPVRFDYNNNYFNSKYQAMPENGYTPIFEKLLDHPDITLQLNTSFDKKTAKEEFAHIVYTGPLDAYFDYTYGSLGYRTLDFVEKRASGDHQGCAVMNYCDEAVPFTRITEHKHFMPGAHFPETIIFEEYSRQATENDEPYYPIRLAKEKAILSDYELLAKEEKNTTFLGRLGTYRYLDMDVAIGEALLTAKNLVSQLH